MPPKTSISTMKMPRRYLISSLIMAIVTILCVFNAPFHVLSRSFGVLVQLISTPVAVVLGFLSSRRIHEEQQAPDTVRSISTWMKKDLIFMCCLAALPYLIITLSSYVLRQCRIFEGSISFWVSVVPSLLFGLVWGYAFGMFTRRWLHFVPLTVGLFIILSIYSVLIQFFGFGYGSEYMYLLFGSPPDQRAGPLPSSFHLYSRTFLVFMTAVVYAWSTLLYTRRHATARVTKVRLLRTVLITFALILLAWSTQGFTGLGWSHSRIRQYLNRTREIDYLRIHHRADHTVSEEIWRKLEWDAHKIAQRMGLSHPEKVDVYMFPSKEKLKEYTNASSSAYAKVGRFYMTERYSHPFSHELVHALHYLYKPSWRIILNRALLEGTAVAFDEGLTLSPEYHEEMATLEKKDKLPSIQAIYEDRFFLDHSEHLAYQASGSFIGFLVLKYGLDKYRQFNNTLSFAKAYRHSLAGLDAQWKGFLRTVPIDLNDIEREQISETYTRLVSYKDRCCPQVGMRRRTEEEDARSLSLWADPAASKILFEELRHRQPETSDWQIRYVLSLIANGDTARAETEIDSLLEREEKDVSLQHGLYRLKLLLNVLNEERHGAIESVKRMVDLSGDVNGWMALRSQMLEHPRIGPAYFSSLSLRNWEQWARLARVYEWDSDFGPPYIYAFYFADAYADPMAKLDFLRKFVRKTSRFGKLKVQAYKDFLHECLRYRQYDEGEYAITQMDSLELSGRDKIEVNDLRGRLGFEKQRFSGTSILPPYRFNHLYEDRGRKYW